MGTSPSFIRKLPLRNANAFALIELCPIQRRHIQYWNAYVQPLIDRHYQRAASRISISRVRADTGWDWAAILLLAKTQSLTHLAPGGQYSRTSTAAIELQGVPVGLMTYVRRFDCRLDGSKRRVTLVWHAASAPVEFYEKMGFAQPSGVMLALLDSAVQSGVIASNSDGLLLRAAPGGG